MFLSAVFFRRSLPRVFVLLIGVLVWWRVPVCGFPATVPRKETGRLDSFLHDAGLVEGKVFDIAFQDDGVVWLAGSDGLYRYDGYFWRRYSTESGLPGVLVRCVLVTKDQTVWVGTDQGAGTFANGKFHLVGDGPSMVSPNVRRMVEDPDGTIWFCHDAWPDLRAPAGLSAFQAGQLRRYGAAEGLAVVSVLNYFRSAAGEQFALSFQPRGGQVFRKTGERWEPVTDFADPISTLVEYPPLGVVGLARERLWSYAAGTWTPHPSSPQNWLPLATSRDGGLWACNSRLDGAVFITRWNGADFIPASPPLPASSGTVEVMKEAPDGSIWCVGDHVLARWNRGPGEWTEFPGLPAPRGIARDGTMWFAGKRKAVGVVGDAVTEVELRDGRRETDEAGNLWAWNTAEIARCPAGRAQELHHWKASEASLASIEGLVIEANGVPWIYDEEHCATLEAGGWVQQPLQTPPEGRIISASPDPRGGVWFVIMEPLGRLTAVHPGQKETMEFPQNAVRQKARRLVVDAGGGRWLYGITGLAYQRSEGGPWEEIGGLAGSDVLQAVQGRAHLWFVFAGTTGGRGGFGFFDGRQWRQAIAEVSGPAAMTADGDLIFAGPGALFIVHGEDPEDVRQVSLPEELQVTNLVPDREGGLWVGGQRGVAGSVTYHYQRDGVPPAVAIVAGQREVREHGRLRIEAIGIEKFQPRQPGKAFHFSWRIDGGPWSAFQPLPEGGLPVDGLRTTAHRLEMRCRDEGGDISPQWAETEFHVTPIPLQSRSWFHSAVLSVFGLIAALAVAALYQARRYRAANVRLTAEMSDKERAEAALQEANETLERRVEERSTQLEEQISARQKAEVQFTTILDERSRLGRELHDTLEQSLAGVAMQLEAAKLQRDTPDRAEAHLELATRLLRESQAEARRSICDLHSQVLEKFDLATALSATARQITEGTSLAVQVVTEGEPRRFSTTVENSLLRICQEAVTNALKHAQAARIVVTLEFATAALTLRIRDDGRGFDTTRRLLPDEGHFGLSGMRERAKRLGGQLEIVSDPSGTTITLQLTTDSASPSA